MKQRCWLTSLAMIYPGVLYLQYVATVGPNVEEGQGILKCRGRGH
jgi:hypothetical protein